MVSYRAAREKVCIANNQLFRMWTPLPETYSPRPEGSLKEKMVRSFQKTLPDFFHKPILRDRNSNEESCLKKQWKYRMCCFQWTYSQKNAGLSKVGPLVHICKVLNFTATQKCHCSEGIGELHLNGRALFKHLSNRKLTLAVTTSLLDMPQRSRLGNPWRFPPTSTDNYNKNLSKGSE